MSHTSKGTLALDRLNIAYALHPYDYDPDAPRAGLQAAEALGIEASQTFKTLMLEVDGKPVCAILPSDMDASLKEIKGKLQKSPAVLIEDFKRITGIITRSDVLDLQK